METFYAPHQIGRAAELYGALFFVLQGKNVVLPVGNQPLWDLLVEEEYGFKRVQVKSAKLREDGSIYVNTTKSGKGGKNRSYTKDDIDYLLAVCVTTGQVWLLAWPDFNKTHALVMRRPDRLVVPPSPEVYARVKTHAYLPTRRRTRLQDALEGTLPVERPPEISEVTWDLLKAHVVDGLMMTELARAYGSCTSSMQERLYAAAKHLCGKRLISTGHKSRLSRQTGD